MARLFMSSVFFAGLLFVSSLLLIVSEARLLNVVESHGSMNKGTGAIFSDGLHVEEIKNSGPSEGGRGHASKNVNTGETLDGPSPGAGH
ncbi:hypothetical protein OIU76_006309 [Salix suchowensis]|nr:hypothetical protein OIU76_006309 [Salix suchowensis]